MRCSNAIALKYGQRITQGERRKIQVPSRQVAQSFLNGCYYKVLTRQGPNATGGASDYVVRGNMIGGFALIAYPAEYGNSGVMTFLVNHQGAVFEKDLGANTGRIAAGVTVFDPDNTWRKVVNSDPPKTGAR